jgi:hypothetical protein
VIKSLSLLVVGADYPNKRGPGRRFEIAMCRPGDPVHLVPEPNNPADQRAIKVVSERDVQMGYLAAERAYLIGRKVAEGAELRAIFQEATKAGAIIRVTLDGSEPALPDHHDRPADPDDSGFYPDDIPPDDWAP